MATVSANMRRARPLLGTFVEIEASGAAEHEMAAAIDAAFAAVARVHELMSFHQADSDVSRINREAHLRPTCVDAWTFRVLETAIEFHRRSQGIFDVTVAPASPAAEAGGDHNARRARSLDAIALFPGQAVRFRHAGIAVDLGGIAKGFAVDRAIEVLRGFGIPSGIVNAGGDLAAYGPAPHVVHIRHPHDPSRLICRVDVVNEALASSGRRFDPLRARTTTNSAVIDPATRLPPQGVDGASVRARSCMVADALTKMVMVAGTEAGDLLEFYNASALVVARDGGLHISSDWHHVVHLAA